MGYFAWILGIYPILRGNNDQEFIAHGALAPFETLFKHSHDKTDMQKLRLFDKVLANVPGSFLVPALQYTLSCIETSQREEFVTMISNHIEKKAFVSIADSLRQEGIQEGMQQVAKNLLASGFDLDVVAQNTGLDIELLKKLKEETQH